MLFALCLSAHAAPLDPLAFDVLGPLLDPSGLVTVDTDTLLMSAGGVSYEGVLFGGIAVWTFASISLDEPLYAEGSHPFALLSRGDLLIDAEIGIYGRDGTPGPGGFAGGTDPEGEDGGGQGGGGSLVGAGGGGFGGDGGESQFGFGAGESYGDLAVSIEGGSGGGKCRDSSNLFDSWENGDGGGGGGAIEIGAVGRLDVTANGIIIADGGDGQTDAQHGGGGGSGGAIALHGAGGLCEGTLSARGGVGGDDGGSDYAEGGGGGGGRIAMLDLQTACVTDVSGGTSPNVDPGSPGVVEFREWIDPDNDADGWTLGLGDCDDSDASIYPGANDLPGDGIDQDCDGIDSEAGPEGTNGTGEPTSPDLPDTSGTAIPDSVVADPTKDESLTPSSGCTCDHSGPKWSLAPILLAVMLARCVRRA